MKNEELVSFLVAKLAKEKGFNEDCYNIYLQKDNNETYVEDSHYYYWQTTTSNLYIEDIIEKRKKLQIKYPNVNFHTGEVCTAPTQSQIQRWFREIHGIHIVIIPTVTSDWTYKTVRVIAEIDNEVIRGVKSIDSLPPYTEVCGYDFSTYEQALEDALFESLKSIKNEYRTTRKVTK